MIGSTYLPATLLHFRIIHCQRRTRASETYMRNSGVHRVVDGNTRIHPERFAMSSVEAVKDNLAGIQISTGKQPSHGSALALLI